MDQYDKVGLGGGCHWCTEAIFQSLKGVKLVEQGWISAHEDRAFSEAVIVHFSPIEMPLAGLVEIHLHTHNCTSRHKLRQVYRSAIYTFSMGQHREAENLLVDYQKDFDNKIITRVMGFYGFRPNSEEYLNYYRNNPQKPFCRAWIQPKLHVLLQQFASKVDPASL